MGGLLKFNSRFNSLSFTRIACYGLDSFRFSNVITKRSVFITIGKITNHGTIA